jgi:lysozyme family protein
MADYKQVTDWIKKWEGGKSKATTDSAKSFPVPDGSGYHTNKGVTWKTFTSLAPKLGYVATPALFYAMPDSVWDKIFRNGYWNVIRGDEIKSQAIAETLVDFAWGAGPGRAIQQLQKYLKLPQTYKMDAKTLHVVNTANEKQLHEGFSNAKAAYYLSLPNQQANYNGWRNRLTDLYNTTVKKLGKGAVLSIAGIVAGSVTLGLFLYSLISRK